MARTIKRYENRKLYDLEEKRYVRLSDIADMIRAGNDVVVIDNATGADLTSQTLAKILIEGESGQPLLTGQSLHDLVRWGGNLLGSGKEQVEQWFDKFVAGAVEKSIAPREMRRELKELRERVKALESLVKQMEKGEQ